MTGPTGGRRRGGLLKPHHPPHFISGSYLTATQQLHVQLINKHAVPCRCSVWPTVESLPAHVTVDVPRDRAT